MVKKRIQVKDSIPSVRCASDNVTLFIVFHRLSLEHPLDPNQTGRVSPVLGFLSELNLNDCSLMLLLIKKKTM